MKLRIRDYELIKSLGIDDNGLGFYVWTKDRRFKTFFNNTMINLCGQIIEGDVVYDGSVKYNDWWFNDQMYDTIQELREEKLNILLE